MAVVVQVRDGVCLNQGNGDRKEEKVVYFKNISRMKLIGYVDQYMRGEARKTQVRISHL